MFVDSELIKKIAFEVGFDACGISSAEVELSPIKEMETWLSKDFNAGMEYLSKNFDIRKNPKLLFQGAKSVISVLLSYNIDLPQKNNDFIISKYAYVKDYHIVMREKLTLMLTNLNALHPEIQGRVFVDSAPVLERYFANKSGLGFIGKNHCLINRNFGSWIFIGEIIANFETDYDKSLQQTCINCNACIKKCPTHALTESGLNANLCISYHTIENRGDIPLPILQKMGNHIFGCDECQSCCPHNLSAQKTTNFEILPQIANFNSENLTKVSNRQFAKQFADTAFSRSGRKKILSSCENVAGINGI